MAKARRVRPTRSGAREPMVGVGVREVGRRSAVRPVRPLEPSGFRWLRVALHSHAPLVHDRSLPCPLPRRTSVDRTPVLRPRVVSPPRRAAPPRAGGNGRVPRRAGRVRPGTSLAAARPRQPVLLPSPRPAAVECGRALPEGRCGAHPEVSGGGGAAAAGEALPHQRGRPGPRDHARELRPGAPPLLLPIEAGGQGGGGGDPASRGDPAARCRHDGPWVTSAWVIAVSSGRNRNDPAPSGGIRGARFCCGAAVVRDRAAHLRALPGPHHRHEEVRGQAGQRPGRPIPRAAGRLGGRDPRDRARPAPREAGEAEE